MQKRPNTNSVLVLGALDFLTAVLGGPIRSLSARTAAAHRYVSAAWGQEEGCV